jgi:hypothetical protein
MSRRGAALVASAIALLAVVPSAALATKPGHWDPVTAANGRNIDQVGLQRTPDGRLHVVWQRKNGDNADLVQTVLAADGSVGPAQTIASDWIGIGPPAIARDANGGLLILAGATSSLDPGAIQDAAAWRSSDGGATWTLQPGDAAHGAGFADDVGAAIGFDGLTPFFAWGTTFGLFVHRGTDGAVGANDFQGHAGFGCCGYDPGLARDGASGQLVVAWYSNATNHQGVFAQAVDQASGAPLGSPSAMPGSTTRFSGSVNSSSSLAHTPIVARAGKSGVFLAYPGNYPTTTRVVVWRFGAAKSTVIATRAAGLANLGIAATPSGRLWAFWSGGGRIYARRSNAKLSAWGAVTSIPVRKGTGAIYKLAGNAQDGVLDVVGSFQGSGAGVQAWHSQIQAGLTLTASPAQLKTGGTHAHELKLKVTDAGEPVTGATVTLGAKSARSGPNGTATFSVGPFARPTTLAGRASKVGYVDGLASVRVVK